MKATWRSAGRSLPSPARALDASVSQVEGGPVGSWVEEVFHDVAPQSQLEVGFSPQYHDCAGFQGRARRGGRAEDHQSKPIVPIHPCVGCT